MPDDKEDPLAKQNIKDRYHGRNDPVARKMLSGYAATKNLIPPEDPSVVLLDSSFRVSFLTIDSAISFPYPTSTNR
jgi:hypothetical protein